MDRKELSLFGFLCTFLKQTHASYTKENCETNYRKDIVNWPYLSEPFSETIPSDYCRFKVYELEE